MPLFCGDSSDRIDQLEVQVDEASSRVTRVERSLEFLLAGLAAMAILGLVADLIDSYF